MTADQELRNYLLHLGAFLETKSNGPFTSETFVVGEVAFELTLEYGIPFLNIGVGGSASFPASFWLAALEGRAEFPDPPVTDEDLAGVIAKLTELIERAPELEASVEVLGDEYSAAIRERLE